MKVLLAVEIDETETSDIIIKRGSCNHNEFTRAKADAQALIEAHNAKNIIEITARCKETTEALIKETEKRVFDDVLKLRQLDMFNALIIFKDIEQLREKYKGVE
jgi:hypothetical protein